MPDGTHSVIGEFCGFPSRILCIRTSPSDLNRNTCYRFDDKQTDRNRVLTAGLERCEAASDSSQCSLQWPSDHLRATMKTALEKKRS